MSAWKPEISQLSGPRYLAIADAVADDIESGKLKPGEQLPTHRDLADRLGLTVGTITRAYLEAERRGLIFGHTGRGTFVRNDLYNDAFDEQTNEAGKSLIDLSFNYTPIPIGDLSNKLLATTFANFSKRTDLTSILLYKHHKASTRHRAAGAEWIARTGFEVSGGQVVVCNGALHAMTVALMVLASPGDTIMVEELTYPGMKSLTSALHLKLFGVAIDKDGIVPEAFDRACRESKSKVLYCVPTIQNPTASILPDERRRELAAIARKHDVSIIEDDIYGFLVPGAPKPVSTYAPERCYYVTSLSKSVAGGLRVGYLAAPPKMIDRFETMIKTTMWTTSPLSAEIAALWIKEGTAAELAGQKRKETAARQEIAVKSLTGCQFDTHPLSYHLWLHMPEIWPTDKFVTEARNRGILVTPPDAFTATQTDTPEAVRLCLGGAPNRKHLEEALKQLTVILSDTPKPTTPII